MANDDLFEGLSETGGATSQKVSQKPLASKRQNIRGNHQSGRTGTQHNANASRPAQRGYSGTPYAPEMRPRDFSNEFNTSVNTRSHPSSQSMSTSNRYANMNNSNRNTARNARSYSSMPAQQEKTKRRSNSSARKTEKESYKETQKAERARGDGLFGGRSFGVVFNDCILWTIEHMPIMFLVAVLSVVVGLFINRYISFAMAFVFCLWGILSDRRFPERDPFIYFGLLALGVFIIPYLF